MQSSTVRYFVRIRQLCILPFQYLRHQRNRLRTKQKSTWLSFTFAFHPFVTLHALSFGFGKRKEEVQEIKPSPEEIIIEEADRLYSENDMLKLYNFLVQHKETKNDEILWRLARAACDKGKRSSNNDEKKSCFFEAFEYVKQALELNDQNFASHKWYAILLDYTAEFEGIKKRLSNSFLVKEHLLTAIKLNPKDATTLYSLGYWCFLFADMPWYQRKIASALFAAPPTSSYEEALQYFEQAEETDPNFYCTNLLMLGKTYLRLKNNDKALVYLKRARDYNIVTPDDQKAHKEAVELLRSIGVKSED